MSSNIKKTKPTPIFQRINIIIILVACVIICIGFALMTGDCSTEATFSEDIFSHRRIVVAPMICLIGYLMVVVGIVYRK
jgi:spore maturation protein SpmA